MIKKSICAKSQIKTAALTANAAQPSVGHRSACSTRPKRPALGPEEQTLCRQAFGIF